MVWFWGGWGSQAVVKNVPAPPGPTGGPLRALIYDSVYDEYKVSLARRTGSGNGGGSGNGSGNGGGRDNGNCQGQR